MTTIGEKALEGQMDFPHRAGRSRKSALVADFNGVETSTMPEGGAWASGVKLAILMVGLAGLWGLIGFGLYAFTR
jgi:hypothetical protein